MKARGKAAFFASLILAASGCLPQEPGVKGLSVPSTYADAEGSYLAGDYARAKTLFARFADVRASSPFVPWAHYWTGKCDLQMGSLRSARLNFTKAAAAQLGPDLQAAAIVGLGDASYNEQDYKKAFGYYRRVSGSRLAGHVRTEEINFKLGMCQKQLGRAAAADKHFDTVLKADPNGTYGALASKMRAGKTSHRLAASPAGRATGAWWFVQAGVFSKPENARDLQRKLRGRGIRAQIVPERKAGATYHAVRIGQYRSEAEANRKAWSVRAAGFQCIVKQ